MQGENKRQLQVAKELQKDMAEIIRSRGMAFWGGALVTVSGVKISSDLSVAKIYLSIFPSDRTKAVMDTVHENARALRGELGSRFARNLRVVPELVFYVDDSLDYVERIDELLKK